MGRSNSVVYLNENNGKRLYYSKSYNYIIILIDDGNNIFELYTAYPMTEKDAREQIRRLFGV